MTPKPFIYRALSILAIHSPSSRSSACVPPYQPSKWQVAFVMGARALLVREPAMVLNCFGRYHSNRGLYLSTSMKKLSHILLPPRLTSTRPPVYAKTLQLRRALLCPRTLSSNVNHCSDSRTNDGKTIGGEGARRESDSNSPAIPRSPAENHLRWPEELSVKVAVTVSEALRLVASWLAHHNVVDPRPSAAELLAKAWGFRSPREMLENRPASTIAALSAAEWDLMRNLCIRRAVQHAPIQYLVEEWDFHKISLEMKPPTLIPRPETEELVDIILEWLRSEATVSEERNASYVSRSIRFLDVGSGTGAIGLALLNELPGATCVAIDSQMAAVSLSRRNAQRTGLQDRYRCLHVDIEGFIMDEVGASGTVAFPDKGINGPFDFIVSNPPYVPTGDMADLPPDVANHEDHVALDGGEDGLDVIRKIVRKCPQLLRHGGSRQLWMEVDTSHPERIQSWLGIGDCDMDEERTQPRTTDLPSGAHGVTAFEWRRDLSQRPRFVRLTFAEGKADALEDPER